VKERFAFSLSIDELITYSLVVPFQVIMSGVFFNHISKMGMIFDKHSSLIDRTNRSAYALRFGLLGGSLTLLTPAENSSDWNDSVNRGSLS